MEHVRDRRRLSAAPLCQRVGNRAGDVLVVMVSRGSEGQSGGQGDQSVLTLLFENTRKKKIEINPKCSGDSAPSSNKLIFMVNQCFDFRMNVLISAAYRND